MVKRAIICVGDTTTHGGKVLEGAPTFTLNG
ncbi:PAAR domain-containing protein, partial [Burkholderia pseudomallei]|nr:PAAR domain-containing protein [Burkholderia pseudomallei]